MEEKKKVAQLGKNPPEAKEPEEKESPILKPIKLTKTQQKLYISRSLDIEAMREQINGIINNLGGEIRRNLVEGFADELGLSDALGIKYGFDRETMSFVDINELRKKQGQPRPLIPGRRNQ